MGHQQKLSSSQPPQPPTHPPSAMHSFKLAFALALVAATMAAASAARQLEQIDIPEAGILEAGINIGSEVFVPSVSFLVSCRARLGLLAGFSTRGCSRCTTASAPSPGLLPPKKKADRGAAAEQLAQHSIF